MSPRAPEENLRIQKERREQILSASLEVFIQKGYTDTKIADIAAAAGISHGLIYHYFRSKEEIYAELVGRLVKSTEATARVAHETGDPRSILLRVLELMLEGMEREPAYYILAAQIMLMAEALPSQANDIFRSGMESARAVAAVIAEGQRAGCFREGDPLQHFVLLYSAITGLAITRNTSLKMGGEPVTVDAATLLRLIESHRSTEEPTTERSLGQTPE